jgi:multicomponent Na+:H+ antiporter subunit D
MGVYPLVIHEETAESFRSGVMYLTYLLVAGAFLLFAILLTYNYSGGEIRLTPGGMPGLADQSHLALYVLFFFYLLGFGAKSAIMPMHIWLPRAMVAPTPVSAVLHAVAVVNVGLYGVIRMVYNVFGPELFHAMSFDVALGTLASITILLSAIYALRVTGLKHMLAYSTVNQLSYVILAIASLHPVALLGGLIHIMYHSFMKITLFYSAGTIITQSGRTRIKQMHGMAKRMPICFAAFLVGAVGVLGLPPVAGWVSKWYMIEGYFTISRPMFAFVFIISTLIELGFFVPPLAYAYFSKEEEAEPVDDDGHGHGHYETGGWEAPVSMLIPLVIVAVMSTIFGLYGSIPLEFGKKAVVELLGVAPF